MIKNELIKARCTAIEKRYLIEFMHHNKYKTLSEALRAILNNHMEVNQIGGAGSEK